MWYETSLESSFDASVQNDDNTISVWYDNNTQVNYRNNATQSTESLKPLFKENVFNLGIPAVRFDGANDYLNFTGTDLVGTNYTIFVVEQKRSSVSLQNTGFLGGSVSSNNSNLFFGYSTDTIMKLSHYGASYSEIATSSTSSLTYNSPTPRIHTGRFSTSDGMSYWLNGGTIADKSDSAKNMVLGSYSGAALGRTYTNAVNKYYNGDLAEIIIYTRALTTEERQSVESYLSKKYSITTS